MSPLGPDQLAVLQRWSAYTVYIIIIFLYIHDVVYVYVSDSSSSNARVLLHVIDKLYPVTQRQHVLLHLLLSHFPPHTWLEASGNMTSQAVGKSACYKWPPYVRGYHEYKSVWCATVGEMLKLTTGLTNPQDPFAVAAIKDGCVVGHVPRTVSQTISFFLGKDRSVSFCELAS